MAGALCPRARQKSQPLSSFRRVTIAICGCGALSIFVAVYMYVIFLPKLLPWPCDTPFRLPRFKMLSYHSLRKMEEETILRGYLSWESILVIAYLARNM